MLSTTFRRAFLAERRGEPCGSGRRDVDSRGGWLKMLFFRSTCTERSAVLPNFFWGETEELAYRVGMDVSYLSEVENGRKEPRLRKIKELAQGLDITVSSMMRGL